MIDLIYLARWRNGANGRGTTLAVGEFEASIRYLATRWEWSTKAVRSFLRDLCDRGTLRGTGRAQEGHTYLLVNYEDWQVRGTAGAQQGHTPGHETEGKSTRRKKRSGEKPAKETWLTPYLTVWDDTFGVPNPGELARYLKPVEDTLGPDATLRRFRAYCESTDPQFASPSRFAKTHKRYANGTPLAPPTAKERQIAAELGYEL